MHLLKISVLFIFKRYLSRQNRKVCDWIGERFDHAMNTKFEHYSSRSYRGQRGRLYLLYPLSPSISMAADRSVLHGALVTCVLHVILSGMEFTLKFHFQLSWQAPLCSDIFTAFSPNFFRENKVAQMLCWVNMSGLLNLVQGPSARRRKIHMLWNNSLVYFMGFCRVFSRQSDTFAVR